MTLDNNIFTQPSCEPTTAVTAPSTTTTTPAASTTVAATTQTTVPAATTIAAAADTVPSTVTTPTATDDEFTSTTTIVTDITLPRTGASLTTQSGTALAAGLVGLAAVFIARRRLPTGAGAANQRCHRIAACR